MKKVISILSMIAGGIVLLSVAAPMVIGSLLKVQAVANTIGIIGGADGPTAVVLVGTLGGASTVIEILLGVVLIVGGIWGLKKTKK